MAVLQGFGLIAVVIAVGWLIAHTGLFGRDGQQFLAKLGISLRLSPVPRGRSNLDELGAMVFLKLAVMPAVTWLVAGLLT